MKTDGIILDIDGTLWDSTSLVAEAYNRAFLEGGVKREVSADDLKKLFGKPMDEIFDILLPGVKKEERIRLQNRAIEIEDNILEEDECDIFYPGVIETIKTLSERVPLFIVSNCQIGYIDIVKKKGWLGPYIKDQLSFGDNGLLKAENISIVVERNGLKAPVYVGDTEGDREACEKAEVPFIFAAYGFGEAEKYAGRIECFSKLPDIIDF